MSFLGEIKRRKVFQVAAVYLVVAWLIMQVVDVVSGPLLLPDWFARVVILLLAIGFPVALILSWAFDLTPQGVVRDSGDAVVSGRRIESVLVGLLVLAVGFMFVDNYVLDSAPDTEQVADGAIETVPPVLVEEQATVLPNSVTVLPFENLSPDPDNAYFAAGVHEELLNLLAKISDLSVISRTSVLRFEDSDLLIPEIADALNVQTIMEGSVRYAGDRVRISAQLIDAETDEHLWSEIYERELADIFAVQAEIAENIAMALEAELLPREKASIEKAPTDSPEAYALFLRARSEPTSGSFRGTAGAPNAIRLLDSAIELDPAFALAYAWKAGIYANPQSQRALIAAGLLESQEMGAQLSQQFIEMALELDPNLTMGRLFLASQAGVLDSEQVRRHYEVALQNAPNDPSVLQSYSQFLFRIGQNEESIAVAERVADLDPAIGLVNLSTVHHFVGNNDVASEILLRAIQMEPTNAGLRLSLGFAEVARGNGVEALEQLRLGEQLLAGTVPGDGVVSEVAYAYARAGSIVDAERFFSQLEEPNGQQQAHIELARGNAQAALELLEAIAATRTPSTNGSGAAIRANLARLVWNSWNDSILDQPEFLEVRRQIGYPE